MMSTAALRKAVQAAAQAERTPMIKFIGKRTAPEHRDHTPQPHPMSPTGALPKSFGSASSSSQESSPAHKSFSSYRDQAQQHGPLRKASSSAATRIDFVGSKTPAELGPVSPPNGVFFDRKELPANFWRRPLTASEMDAVETGGATLVS